MRTTEMQYDIDSDGYIRMVVDLSSSASQEPCTPNDKTCQILQHVIWRSSQAPAPANKSKNIRWLTRGCTVGDQRLFVEEKGRRSCGSINKVEFDEAISAISKPSCVEVDVFYKRSEEGTYSETISCKIPAKPSLGDLLSILYKRWQQGTQSGYPYTEFTFCGLMRVGGNKWRVMTSDR